jgi:hypothetical protein
MFQIYALLFIITEPMSTSYDNIPSEIHFFLITSSLIKPGAVDMSRRPLLSFNLFHDHLE